MSVSKAVEAAGGTILWCPTPDCGYPFEPYQGQAEYNCVNCSRTYCLICKIVFHTGKTCQAYHAELKAIADAEAKRIADLAARVAAELNAQR
jgi:hypothetical protein